MTIRSDEITMGNPNFVHGFSYCIIAMLPQYQLIDKRVLYNTCSGKLKKKDIFPNE